MKHLHYAANEHASFGELFDFKKGEAHYPDVPGFKRHGTSEEAAAEVAQEASELQLACFACLKIAPSTADEVAAQLGRSVLAIRPRISELVAKDWVVETPQRRLNASGKWAAVWRVA